ncbi:MAG: hypothetical protein IPH16_19800 [Haliscomenobacter sp.]|nr:hypothetical protein [Haliscomenobacter sp.]
MLLTFSPSGYEVQKNYPQSNAVAYLPADTSRNVRDFLRLVQPNLAVFVKYEFWYRFLEGLRNQTIPTILISARLRPGHLFFQRYGGWFKTLVASLQPHLCPGRLCTAAPGPNRSAVYRCWRYPGRPCRGHCPPPGIGSGTR